MAADNRLSKYFKYREERNPHLGYSLTAPSCRHILAVGSTSPIQIHQPRETRVAKIRKSEVPPLGILKGTSAEHAVRSVPDISWRLFVTIVQIAAKQFNWALQRLNAEACRKIIREMAEAGRSSVYYQGALPLDFDVLVVSIHERMVTCWIITSFEGIDVDELTRRLHARLPVGSKIRLEGGRFVVDVWLAWSPVLLESPHNGPMHYLREEIVQ